MPVIFLTSKDDEVDELLGLRMGADDYITKPFSQRLLIERIRALLRREQLSHTNAVADPSAVLTRGELTLDSNRHACLWNGRPIELTVTEFLLVKALAIRPGHVKSRDQLMDAGYGRHIYGRDRTIDRQLNRITKKIKAGDDSLDHTETIYD